MQNSIKNLCAILALFLTLTSFAGGEGWLTNWEEAKKKAAAENKSLLVDFTGSDWCGWCIRLKEEVFSKKGFSKYAEEKFVLVEIDFPRNDKRTEELKKQNTMLAQKYQVRGYPTILLLDEKGRPFAKTGYQAGGPQKYTEHLEKLLKVRATRDKSFAEAEKLQGTEKAIKLVEALKALGDMASHYPDVIKTVKELDPEDKSGFIRSEEIKAGLMELQQKAGQAAQGKQFDTIAPMVDKFIEKYQLTGEDKQKALFSKIMSFEQKPEHYDAVIELMDSIIKIDNSTQTGARCNQIKQYVVGLKNKK